MRSLKKAAQAFTLRPPEPHNPRRNDIRSGGEDGMIARHMALPAGINDATDGK